MWGLCGSGACECVTGLSVFADLGVSLCLKVQKLQIELETKYVVCHRDTSNPLQSTGKRGQC